MFAELLKICITVGMSHYIFDFSS